MRRAAALAAFVAVTLAACAADDYAGSGGGGSSAWNLGPGYVDLGGNRRFGVSYLPDMEAAILKFSVVGSFAGAAPEPPTPEDWRAAAEKAAPEGCTVAAIEQVDEETWQASYDCAMSE